ESGTAVAQPENPTMDGFKFTYWSTSVGASKAYNFATVLTANTMLYAHWVEYVTVTVTFMLNERDVYKTVEIESGTAVARPENPFKSGYTFAFWATEIGQVKPYDFSKIVSVNTILYANWTESNTFVVRFYVDDAVYAQYNIANGGTVEKPVDPVKEGYNFTYWSKSVGGRAFSFTTAITAETNLYANWEKKVLCTITFTVDGEFYCSSEVYTGDCVSAPTPPVKEGFVFLYWCKDGEAYNFTEKITGSMTLTALFTEGEVTYVTVTYYVDGDVYATREVIKNGLAPQIEAPTKSGWWFDCWITAGEVEYDFSTPVTADLSLYAKFGSDYTIENGELKAYNGTSKDLIIPEGVTFINGVTTHSSIFTGLGIKSIVLPSTLVIIGDYAFYACMDMVSIDMSKCTKLTTIGHRAFHLCKLLTKITIPASVTEFGVKATALGETDGTGIFGFVFYGCAALQSFEIEAGSQLTDLGNKHFWNCTSLKKLVLPASITNIGQKLFNNCILEELYIYATKPPVLSEVKDNNSFSSMPTTTKIYIPKGSYDTYAEDLYWMGYFDQLIEMEGESGNSFVGVNQYALPVKKEDF
ncbi:MAG: InlB B-repeat-containing protein, partial [Clostridia bacterium]|nr:InlB B-repeat-containing protein [Clostridia bacterium]